MTLRLWGESWIEANVINLISTDQLQTPFPYRERAIAHISAQLPLSLSQKKQTLSKACLVSARLSLSLKNAKACLVVYHDGTRFLHNASSFFYIFFFTVHWRFSLKVQQWVWERIWRDVCAGHPTQGGIKQMHRLLHPENIRLTSGVTRCKN